MRTSVDAQRSLRRYIGEILPAYDVQPVREEGQDRPLAVVRPIPGADVNSGSAYIHDITQRFQVFVYPQGTEGDPVAGTLEAEQVADLLRRAFLQGGFGGGYAWRVPVFDYDGVPATPTAEQVPTEPYDFLLLGRPFHIEQRPDPDDDTLFTVTLDLRLSWSDVGDTRRFEGAKLHDLTVHNVSHETWPVGISREIRYHVS